MARDDWFRRTTWTERDRTEFHTRLNRCRGTSSKAQYVRIQALHLAKAGLHDGAIELLDLLFSVLPDKLELATAHDQKAESLIAKGDVDAALEQYRLALKVERDFPNVRTNTWLDFPWFIATRGMSDLYDEAIRTLNEGDTTLLLFPVEEYRYSTIQALIADERGMEDEAREAAGRALAAAGKEHSGLRYHPTLGLVGDQDEVIKRRLESLAGE